MQFGIQALNGFFFGLGLILVAFVMKFVFQIGFCG